jgi:hypothetical protein
MDGEALLDVTWHNRLAELLNLDLGDIDAQRHLLLVRGKAGGIAWDRSARVLSWVRHVH